MATALGTDVLDRIVEQMLLERTRRGLALLQELTLGLGPVVREAGRLRAGTEWLDEQAELIANVKRAAGVEVAIYDDNRCIVTTADSDRIPERPRATDPPEDIVEQVLGGMDFHGVTRATARACALGFAPLSSLSGKPVGMLATFVDQDRFIAEFDELRAPMADIHDVQRRREEQREQAGRKVIEMLDRTTARLRIAALNASIVSARSGQRTGLDVVAREMGKLTDDLRDLLTEVNRLLPGGSKHLEEEVAPSHANAAAAVGRFLAGQTRPEDETTD